MLEYGVNTSSPNGAATDLDGIFKFENLKIGQYKLTVSYIGYETKIIEINIDKKTALEQNIYLASESTEMDNIVISAGKFELPI